MTNEARKLPLGPAVPLVRITTEERAWTGTVAIPRLVRDCGGAADTLIECNVIPEPDLEDGWAPTARAYFAQGAIRSIVPIGLAFEREGCIFPALGIWEEEWLREVVEARQNLAECVVEFGRIGAAIEPEDRSESGWLASMPHMQAMAEQEE